MMEINPASYRAQTHMLQKYTAMILLLCLAFLLATFQCVNGAATPVKPTNPRPVEKAPIYPRSPTKPSPTSSNFTAGGAKAPISAPPFTPPMNPKPLKKAPSYPVSPIYSPPLKPSLLKPPMGGSPAVAFSPMNNPAISLEKKSKSKSPTRKPSKKPSRKPSRKPSKKPSRKPSKKPSRKPSSAPSNSPSGTYWTRAASAPICSSTSQTTYLAPKECSNITCNTILKQIEVAFCDTNAIAGFRIYEFNATATLSYSLYGIVGKAWTFLVAGTANAAASLSITGKNYLEVKFPSAYYPAFRLTFSSFYGFELPNVKFLQAYSTNCEKSYKFRTKEALQLAVQQYTADDYTKKQMIDSFGVMICWNVALITDMSNLFYNKTLFDEDISCWDCSKVRNTSRMFYNAQSFKGDLGRWNLSNVEDMSEMFFGATSFASSVSTWTITNVKSMTGLFYNASSFNQDLCTWYNLIDLSVATDNMFSLSGCNDRSDPNVTSKTSFCQECSCCGGSCFNPVGSCEDGYNCSASTNLCVKPVEPDYCRIKTRESYGCQDFYECHQLINYTTPTCTKPFLGGVCKPVIGCLDGLVCSNGICLLPNLYQYCNSTNYGCSPGFTCDSPTLSCRIPYLNESCLPSNGTNFGCDLGHLCKNSVCALPTLNDTCEQTVGCVSGYSCDFFTSLCRKPNEAELCLPQDVSTAFGCQDGLQCTNVNLLARATSTTGNILAKFYNLPPNTTVLPNFDNLTWYFVTYVENITYDGNGVGDVGAVFEGNLRFPLNGTWTIYVTSNTGYNLLANNVSMVTSDGTLNESSNPMYISTSNQTQKIRVELFDTWGNSSMKLQWLSPGINETRADIPSSSWDPDEYSCSKPLGQNYSSSASGRALASWNTQNLAACADCVESIGCFNGLNCVNECCVKPNVTQQCITQIGCLAGLTCDKNFTVCRKPVVNETCEDAVGCQEGLFCKNMICMKPSLNERCIDSMGCFDDGAVCRYSTNTSEVCEKPTSGESCTLSLGCSVGYVCDQNLKTCRLPQLSETCFNTCANGYTCRNDTNTCYLPIENEACVSSMGCQIGYICKSYGTGLTLCELPLLGERCDFDVQCGDSTLLCEWAGPNTNYCRNKKFAGENCRTDDDCLDQASCLVHPNVEVSIYDCPMPSSSPSFSPSFSPSLTPSLTPSKEPSERPSTKPSARKPVVSATRRQLTTPTSPTLLSSGFCGGSISLVESMITSNINYSSVTSDCFGSGRDSDILANFTGYLQFPKKGRWTLYIQSDGEAMLYLNGSTIISNPGRWEESSAIVEIAYDEQTEPFTVEAIQASGGCRLIMSWKETSKQVVPLNAFVSGNLENPNPTICLDTLPYAIQLTTRGAAELNYSTTMISYGGFQDLPGGGGFSLAVAKPKPPASNPNPFNLPDCCAPFDQQKALGFLYKRGDCVEYSNKNYICYNIWNNYNYCNYLAPWSSYWWAAWQNPPVSCYQAPPTPVYTNSSINLHGNTWKAFQLSQPYNVTKYTVLLFSFYLTTEAEGHAICVDEDGDYDTFEGQRRRCVAIAGTQKDQWDNDLILSGDKFRVTGTDIYQVPLGNLFDTSVSNNINFIALIQDNDADPLKGESSFQDITFFEDSSLLQSTNIFSAVTLCEQEDFSGKCYGLGVGQYSSIVDYGIPNDWASSVKVRYGYSVTVFVDYGFSGGSTAFTADTATMGDFDNQVSSLKVTSTSADIYCSCQGSGTIDYTGRPLNLSATQDNGFVRFNFADNSLCEEAFSFTRSLVSEEFVLNVSEKGSSFTSDYYANSKSPCGGVVAPGTESADDLTISKLPVGQMVTYCVRAVAQKYMDSPGFETSSDEACTTHKVLWEASINGKVTTKPNAGRSPIPDVTVNWYVLDPTQTSVVLVSGSSLTTSSGSFDIVIKSADVISKDVNTNDASFPVKVTFFKQLGNETGSNHAFLCNDGQFDCSRDGIIVYLKHLQFNEELDVYDNSAVLFSGTLLVQNTSCPITYAAICLYETTTAGSDAELVCGQTDDEGLYSLGVVIGSKVHKVGITYNGHTFILASTNPYDYDAGVLMEAENAYLNNNFVDTTTGSLTVEIVGGKCDRRLGISTIQVQIFGCPSSAKRYNQGGPSQMLVLPAQMLSVQVLDIKDDNGDRRFQMFEFFQGSPPQERLFNLTNFTEAGTVRFQYDGELQIKFSIERSKERMDQKGSCPQEVTDEYSLTGNSVHVIKAMTIYNIRVDFLFQIIPEEGVTCDMVDDTVKLRIFNQAGADAISDKLFLDSISDNITKEALLHCSDGCIVNATNDTSGHNAGVDYSLMTGQPNIIAPYTKRIFFQVIGVSGDVSYIASIIVTGPYSKGPGQSFALPTHYPVMILRDPPGGLSYASYQNVVTKFSLTGNDQSNENYIGGETTLQNVADQQTDMCVGGGFGVIALVCKTKTVSAKTHWGFEGTVKTGVLSSGSDQTSNEISTTWSFETSQDPWLAGKMSDVFVVPNLNVLYQIVTQVSWNASSCGITAKDEILFNLNAPENKPAIAFYSRWHILNVKLPELKYAIEIETDDQKRETLQEGYDGWEAALNKEAETVKIKTSLTDTFTFDDLKSQASLIPSYLQDHAEPLTNSLEKAPLKDINRLQFSGGGNTFTLTMSQDKVADHLFSTDYTILESETKLGGDAEGTVFGVGFEGDYRVVLSVATHYVYSEQTTDTNSTEVSIVLGDPDTGDEFVVELFRDNTYGSFIVETIAGQSSCPWEDKTAKNLDPRIVLTSLPSSTIMQDETMIFEVELANLGVGNGSFILLADDNSNYEELSLSYYNSPISLGVNDRVTKLVQVSIGPRLFQYNPVDLIFREACYDDAQVQQQNLYSPFPRITLQNIQNEKGSFLEFVEPCPEVEWAGEIKRDQSFLINKQSDSIKDLPILIRNPDYSNEKFQDKERLESIFLWYRRQGDISWIKALGKVSDGGTITTKELDFNKYGAEDNYGFVTNLKWLLSGVVMEGIYEIKVECECFAAGGPKDYDSSSTAWLTGVYDITAPKIYGYPLPLDDIVLIGEEIIFVFTEPLQCSKPYSFDIQMRLYGSSTGNIPLQVICEGNHVSFQVDQDQYNVTKLMGKKFVVEIGTIGSQSSAALMDLNGNPLEYNVQVTKTFANLDLSQASSSFEFVLGNVTCTDSTVSALRNSTREKIRVILGMSSVDRIQIIDMNCFDNKNTTVSTVIIMPSTGRRLLSSNNKEDDNSVNLFYALQNASAEKKPVSRMLVTGGHEISSNHYVVQGIKITPGEADIALFSKNATVLRMEKKIRDFQKTFHLNAISANEMKDLAIDLLEEVQSISEESHKERAEIQEEHHLLQSLLKKQHFQDAEMREMKATYEAEMLEHEHSQELELKKIHDEEVRMLHSMEMNTLLLETIVVMVATISLAVGLLFLLKR